MAVEYRSPKIFLTTERLHEVLNSVGVHIISETEHDYLGYCPFHDNRDSPAFNISKDSPYLWKCWNGACAQKGNIYTLLVKKGYAPKEARRMLLKGVVGERDDLVELLHQLMSEDKEELNEWLGVHPDTFGAEDERWGWPARTYANSRGITDEAFAYFRMGYSHKKRMLVIPSFNEAGSLVGVIGRSIEGKSYRYSRGLERGSIVWNLNNAKESSDTIILTEGALDTVYIWQAGYANVGSILGSAISENQWLALRKFFHHIVCFFDNDQAGKALTHQIIHSVSDLGVSVAQYPDRVVPAKDKQGNEIERPVKDPGELWGQEIQEAINEAKSSLIYLLQETRG
jgi:DNA primase